MSLTDMPFISTIWSVAFNPDLAAQDVRDKALTKTSHGGVP
eukprot:CAMPEP_0115718530 /NCGR_PEP_ID=MMETSP0272-20121206/77474_1 /TAXON_ID=71861 /ORGANISM="Scrippsiella trochoidea, Strain CCMP3099" /LENGTH=40 /DNA_ID= /DNA_START= /DNA_END= /DNA_ORIENTATION=